MHIEIMKISYCILVNLVRLLESSCGSNVGFIRPVTKVLCPCNFKNRCYLHLRRGKGDRISIFAAHYCRAAGALPQSAEDTIGRNPCVQGRPDDNHYAVQCKITSCCRHTIFFKFKICHAIGSFENRKIPVRACSTG